MRNATPRSPSHRGTSKRAQAPPVGGGVRDGGGGGSAAWAANASNSVRGTTTIASRGADIGDLQQTSFAVGPLGQAIPLAGPSARQFAQAGGITDRRIDVDVRGIETLGQCLQQTRDQALVRGGQFHTIQQMVPVAA